MKPFKSEVVDEIRLILILIFVLMHYIVKQVSQILENKTAGLVLSEFLEVFLLNKNHNNGH